MPVKWKSQRESQYNNITNKVLFKIASTNKSERPMYKYHLQVNISE